MIIDKPGIYRWTKDTGLRGPTSIYTYRAGETIVVRQIDRQGRKIIGSAFPDWVNWDQPLEPVTDEDLRRMKP